MNLLLVLLFSYSSTVMAAACCGGGFAAPSLISGDDKAQMTFSLSHSEISDDVFPSGLWQKRTEMETGQTLKIEGGHIFSDRWQAGASVAIVQRSNSIEDSTGLGDTNLTLGYEYLPDWNYNPWRPKGLGFLQLVLPTGKSVWESNNPYGLDSRGRGFFSLGLGTLLTKIVQEFDLFLSADIHRSFNRNISTSQFTGDLKPGWGGNFGFGAGYNLDDWRLGTSLMWTYEDAVKANGGIQSEGRLQRFATAGLSVSYVIEETLSATLAYSDQTLFGSPVNASLGQSAMVQVQKRWSR